MNPGEANFHGNHNRASEIVTLPNGAQVTKGSTPSRMVEILRDPEALRIAERLVIKISTKANSNSASIKNDLHDDILTD